MINQLYPKYIVIANTIPNITSDEWINGDKNSAINDYYLYNKNNFDLSYEYIINKRNKNINLNRITPKYIIISKTIPNITSDDWINGDKNSAIDEFFVFNKNFKEDLFISKYDYKIKYRKTENIVSNICFDKHCKVLTNYGYIKLCDIDIDKHTINNHKIIALTKTIYRGKELIIMKKNSLGKGVPSCNTIMTKEHCILFKNKLIPANKFVGRYNTMSYDNRYVYNILLDTWSTMIVNNMIVETLNPKNITAQLYQTKENMKLYIEAHNYAMLM